MSLSIPVDSEKTDMGVSDLIEAQRDLFELTGGREEIASLMTALLADKRRVTRQMIEKWFNQRSRTIPSGVLLVTLLTACAMIREQIHQLKTKTMKAA